MDLDKIIDKFLPQIIELRHEFHQIPELAGLEFETSKKLRTLIDFDDVKLLEPFLETDVVAILNGENQNANLTLRADIDGLPLVEKTCKAYTSIHPNRMHGCGHDGHMAILFGSLLVLRELKNELNCSVRFIFQPGEEIKAMAKQLVDAGVLQNPKSDFVAGLHSWVNVPHGKISTREGCIMGAAGFFSIELTGIGGHGSMPQLANNPIECAAKIINAPKDFIKDNCVLCFCNVESGNNSNIIPEQLFMQGTIRYLDEKAGNLMLEEFTKLVENICEESKVKCKIKCEVNYLPTVNQKSGYKYAKKITHKYLGRDNFVEMEKSSMSSEDFCYYLKESNGVYVHLGAGFDIANLHNDKFDFDDNLIKTGIKYFVGLALDFNVELTES